jgi:hypothetical protein
LRSSIRFIADVIFNGFYDEPVAVNSKWNLKAQWCRDFRKSFTNKFALRPILNKFQRPKNVVSFVTTTRFVEGRG